MSGRGLAGAALVVAAGVAGCAGPGTVTAGELERDVVEARDRTDAALARVTQAESKDELLERMDEAGAIIADAADELDDAGAPERYETGVKRLVDALEQLAFDVQAIADQARQPGFEDLVTGTRGLSFASWDRVNRALEKLAEQGIEVVLLERH